MKIENVNILSDTILKSANALCFTSNGIIKNNNELVMGAGVALQFKNKWPSLALFAGQMVKVHGNICQIICNYDGIAVIAFPTKYHWKQPSDLDLIKKSAYELVKIVNEKDFKTICLTPPGCGLGNLNWETQIKPMIESILDDRFTICFL